MPAPPSRSARGRYAWRSMATVTDARRRTPHGRTVPGAEPLEVVTADGVRLRGHSLGAGHDALVFCHGFGGSATKPRLVATQRLLAERFTVFAFDLRGHGWSEGTCTFGADEQLDVDAAVRMARDLGFERVI